MISVLRWEVIFSFETQGSDFFKALLIQQWPDCSQA